jgi:hypothetical protein
MPLQISSIEYVEVKEVLGNKAKETRNCQHVTSQISSGSLQQGANRNCALKGDDRKEMWAVLGVNARSVKLTLCK